MLENYGRATLPYNLRKNIHPKIRWEWVRICRYIFASVRNNGNGVAYAWRNDWLLAPSLLLSASPFELVYFDYRFRSGVINSVLDGGLLIGILP
jgi:hypothetical protein